MAERLITDNKEDKLVKLGTIPLGHAARFPGTTVEDAFTDDGFWIVLSEDPDRDDQISLTSSDFKTKRSVHKDINVYRHNLVVQIDPEVSK